MRRSLGTLTATSLLVLGLGLGFGRARTQDEPAKPSPKVAALVGVRIGKVYHRPTCPSLRKVAAKGRVALADAEAAESGGYKPCPTCKPDDPHAEVPASPAKGGNASDEVLFSRDVAPVLIAACANCHGGAAPKKKLDMGTFAKLLKGSENGKVIELGKPEESELILRVKGKSTGRRMPPGNDPLAPSSIARLEAWVRAGARLDPGLDPNAEVRKYAAAPDQARKAEIARLPADERDKLAESAGRDRWRKAGASGEPVSQPSAHFLLLATIPADRADRLLKTLESQHARLKALLGPAGAKTLESPVRIGVYVVNEAGTYAEFVRGVERRNFEPTEQAHADLAADAPYLVSLDPLGGGEEIKTQGKGKSRRADVSGPMSLEGLLSEALGREAVARGGKPPRWLVEGVGLYLASQVDPRAQTLNQLRASALGQNLLNWPAKANDALRGETDPESIRAIGLSQVEWLAGTQRAQFPVFVRALIQEEPAKFDDLVRAGWGVSRDQYIATWGGWVRSSYARIRGD